MMYPAVFLDRDGTLIEQVHHLVDPADVRLIDGAASAIARLREHGFRVIVVTNQSVIGRGMLDEQGLQRVHEEMNRQLEEAGTGVDGIYFCPLAPVVSDPRQIEHPDRKPGPGMLLKAARELGLDLTRSWMIGDMISDILAGRNAGVKGTIAVRTGYGQRLDETDPAIDYVVDDLAAAVEVIVGS
jgi:histidinol-phosphate phosphatase family protein